MSDQNVVLLTGRLMSAAERTVGQRGQTLVELRLAVMRPGRKGEGESETVLPVTIWAGEIGAAVHAWPSGAPLTVVARLQAREWTSPSGQTRTFVEIVGESVSVDVAAAPRAVQRELGIETSVTSARPSRERPRDPRAAAEDEGDPTPY